MDTIKKLIDLINQINSSIVVLTIFGGYMFYLFKKLKPYTTITKDIADLKTDISTISKELKPNGGKSIKDQINDLQLSTKTILYRQRWILDNREEPIFETDEKGNFTWANDALMRLTDRSFRDLENNNWINALCEKTRDEVNDSWQIAIENKRNFEHEVVIVDSKKRCFSAKCHAVIQEDKKYIGKFVNIKELKDEEKTC